MLQSFLQSNFNFNNTILFLVLTFYVNNKISFTMPSDKITTLKDARAPTCINLQNEPL